MQKEILNFAAETGFQERLLQKIKMECFGQLSDDDLEFINAAGVTASPESMMIGLATPELNQ